MRGERRTWSGQWLFSPSNTSASVFTRHKNFFQKYKKKKKLFFRPFFIWACQLIYWFRPSFDNFRSRAGRPERENNEEWDEKWPCVRFKIFKKKNWTEIKRKNAKTKKKSKYWNCIWEISRKTGTRPSSNTTNELFWCSKVSFFIFPSVRSVSPHRIVRGQIIR